MLRIGLLKQIRLASRRMPHKLVGPDPALMQGYCGIWHTLEAENYQLENQQ